MQDRKKQARTIYKILETSFTDTATMLNYREDPWRLLVGAILAAQCTDARVNLVTPALFEAYPTIEAFSQTTAAEIEPFIRSCGLFRNKAKNIQAAATHLKLNHDSVVPETEAELLAIPGVGRKIANLILGDSFGKQAVVVDTHCARISKLMGLTESKQPVRIEKDLMACLPEAYWTEWGHLLVTLGRQICIARRPKCEICPVRMHCDYGLEVSQAEDRS